ISLVLEDAIGFAWAIRKAGRSQHFTIVSFGHDCSAIREEWSHHDSPLMGIIDLHPDRYGEGVFKTAVKILNAEAVPPAVFVQHSFLSREDAMQHHS
ncbi:MAG: hypothetical protein P1S60_18465, partial [Anaerolineae bacterium]|nr:hypothetical protein [Anaerolineae bacterium]